MTVIVVRSSPEVSPLLIAAVVVVVDSLYRDLLLKNKSLELDMHGNVKADPSRPDIKELLRSRSARFHRSECRSTSRIQIDLQTISPLFLLLLLFFHTFCIYRLFHFILGRAPPPPSLLFTICTTCIHIVYTHIIM